MMDIFTVLDEIRQNRPHKLRTTLIEWCILYQRFMYALRVNAKIMIFLFSIVQGCQCTVSLITVREFQSF